MGPVRTCLGCRQRAPRSSLLRVVARDGRAVVDTAARLPGRGSWLHADEVCIRTALQRKALGRALKVLVTDTSSLDEWVERPMDS